MKYVLYVLGLIAANSGIGLLICLAIQKLTKRNINLAIRILKWIFILSLASMGIVFIWYVLAMS